MSTSKSSPALVIAWIDHERDKVARLTKKIGERDCGQVPVRKLNELCRLLPITINLKNINPDRLATAVIERLEETGDGHFPDIIFVDINLGPPSMTGEDRAANRGINLASQLRERLPQTPVGMYTAFHLSSLDKVRISMMHFAATLENINDLAEGQRDVMLTGDEWLKLFQDILEVAKEEGSRLPRSLAIIGESEPQWKEGHPISRSLGFLRAAPRLVARTLEHLPNKPAIEIAQLSGGFSGSFLVKADISGGNAAFVIKIDEDPSRLSMELKGYQIIEARIQHQYYLPLAGRYREVPVSLTPDWWGAFAMAYEFDARPLIEQSLSGAELSKLYRALWDECLFSLYGEAKPESVEVGKILPDNFADMTAKGWNALNRYEGKFELSDRGAIDQIRKLIQRLKQIESGDVLKKLVRVPWVEHVHGDLNCRNILYNKEQNSFRILDFPHVGPANCLAIDFAKAEAELVLLMLDWSSGMDCDFARIALWKNLTRHLAENLDLGSAVLGDSELECTFEAIQAVRETYKARANGHGDVSLAYRLILFSRIIRYLNYSDLTIAKRYLAFVWAAQMSSVLDELETA
jgi:hypothetical protein